jgi:uncharacterized protein (DUF58 family)
MFVRDGFKNSTPVLPSDHFIGLRRFVDDNVDALTHAASLLAGAKGRRIVTIILEGLQNSIQPSARTMRALQELLSILSLENVHDEMSDECGFFAAIDPCDPAVADICLLTDGLRTAMQEALAQKSAGKHHLVMT